MKEATNTLVEFLDKNPKISSLVVSGIFPLDEVVVFLQNGKVSYSMYLSNRKNPARYLADEIEKLPRAYKDRIIFDPLKLSIVKGLGIEDRDEAILYIDKFMGERMNGKA